jgi:hypothetical protein
MGYKLLGMLVWKGAKWFLRRKYGSAMAPKPVLAVGLLLVVFGAVGVAFAARHASDGGD